MPPSQYLNRIHDYESHHVYFATKFADSQVVAYKVEQQKVPPPPIQTKSYIIILTLLFYSRALKTTTVCNTI